MYFLIGIWGHDRRIYAALKFFVYTMTGSMLMLAAIIYLYNQSGTFDYVDILSQDRDRPVCARPSRGVASVSRVFPLVRDQGSAVSATYLAA